MMTFFVLACTLNTLIAAQVKEPEKTSQNGLFASRALTTKSRFKSNLSDFGCLGIGSFGHLLEGR